MDSNVFTSMLKVLDAVLKQEDLSLIFLKDASGCSANKVDNRREKTGKMNPRLNRNLFKISALK